MGSLFGGLFSDASGHMLFWAALFVAGLSYFVFNVLGRDQFHDLIIRATEFIATLTFIGICAGAVVIGTRNGMLIGDLATQPNTPSQAPYYGAVGFLIGAIVGTIMAIVALAWLFILIDIARNTKRAADAKQA